MKKVVGNWDQRENGEEYDRMCEKCYKARRGNIEILCLIFYKELHKGVRYHPRCSR